MSWARCRSLLSPNLIHLHSRLLIRPPSNPKLIWIWNECIFKYIFIQNLLQATFHSASDLNPRCNLLACFLLRESTSKEEVLNFCSKQWDTSLETSFFCERCEEWFGVNISTLAEECEAEWTEFEGIPILNWFLVERDSEEQYYEVIT